MGYGEALVTIWEALIDFVPTQREKSIKDIYSFRDFLVETLKSEKMYTRYIKMTNESKTYLTFVALNSEG